MNKHIGKYLLAGTLALITTTQIACAEDKEDKKSQKSGNVVTMNDSIFRTQVFDYQSRNEEWKYLGKKPAIIDFYADWCGPCRAIAPILEDLAMEYRDSIIIYKVNVDKEQSLAGWAGIRSIPALLFVPMDGKPQMMIGQQSKETYTNAIRKLLLK